MYSSRFHVLHIMFLLHSYYFFAYMVQIIRMVLIN